MSTQACIQPNPDIAGVGVRISIYVQSAVSLVQAIWYTCDGELDPNEQRTLQFTLFSLAITAFALTLSAIIQAHTSGLSVYHALIVLNLSWMLMTSALIVSIFAILHTIKSGINTLMPSLLRKRTQTIVFPTLHLLVVGCFGIWVWAEIDVFGDQPQCTPKTFTTIFGHNVAATNKTIRPLFLAVYSFTAIPVANVLGFSVLVAASSCALPKLISLLWCGRKFNDKDEARLQYFSIVGILGFINTVFVVDTELMIHRSKPMVFEGESAWTFGQTFSMLILLPILGEYIAARPRFQPSESQRKAARKLVVDAIGTDASSGDIDHATNSVLHAALEALHPFEARVKLSRLIHPNLSQEKHAGGLD
jgi:hypothetical protein